MPVTGASEQARFMDTPQIGPANIASRAEVTAQSAMPAFPPFSFAPVETFRIVNINRKLRINSKTQTIALLFPRAGAAQQRMAQETEAAKCRWRKIAFNIQVAM